MAKTGVMEGCDGGDTVVAKAAELKRELQKLVNAIASDDGGGGDVNLFESIERAHQTLYGLKELMVKQQRSLSLKRRESVVVVVPEEFQCPLSKELMRDPVIVSSGQTYDRPFIQNWLKAGNTTCPRTQRILSHTILTPNNLIRDLICQWCKNNGIQLPDPVPQSDYDRLMEADRHSFTALLNKLCSSESDQKVAAKELRSLTKRLPSFRALFGESPDVVSQLLLPLSQNESLSDAQLDLQEDIITTLLNLSIHDSNKKLVAENPIVIPILVHSLQCGTTETRSNAAAALFTLSALDSNKALIGKSGALKPLIDLLDEGHPLIMKDVASAVFSLCILQENRTRAVRDGVVGVILKQITSGVHVDELLAILAMLSSIQKAVEEMGEFGAVPCLLNVLREASCARSKENCIAVLYTICSNDRTKWKEMRDEEISYGTISQLAQNGTSRAKRKASGILERLNRAVALIHTA